MAKPGDACLQLVLQVDETQILFRCHLWFFLPQKVKESPSRAALCRAGEFKWGLVTENILFQYK